MRYLKGNPSQLKIYEIQVGRAKEKSRHTSPKRSQDRVKVPKQKRLPPDSRSPLLPQHSNHQAGATITKNVFPLPYLTAKDKTMELMLFWGRFSVATVAKSHNRWMLQLQKDWESSLRIQDNLETQSRQGTDMKLPLPNTILSH